MRGLIKHHDYEVEYFVYGKGKEVLFAFHGFNNHAEDFKPFGEKSGNDYTVVAINIFFHGDSHAHNDIVEKGFSIDDMQILFNEFAGIFPAEKYTLMGYSLGGRMVLKFLEIFPERIERIILLAPDGIRISSFYKYLTGTGTGRNLLRRVIDKPAFFFSLARSLRSSKIVGEKKYQFAMGNFDTRLKRQKVYMVWMILRKILSNMKDIKKIIKKYDTPIHLFFGKYDSIIPPSLGLKFQKGMEELITLNVLESGHRMLKEKTLIEVAEILDQIKNDPRIS